MTHCPCEDGEPQFCLVHNPPPRKPKSRLALRRWWARRILHGYKYTRPPAHGVQIDHQRPER